MQNFRIISWNLLHSVGAMVDDIAALIVNERPDLFLMQEVTGVIDALPTAIGGHYFRHHWAERRHGLAVWSREAIAPSSVLRLPASRFPGSFPERVAQILEMGDVTIANVHLSHGQFLNRRQLARIARSTSGPTAIIGDFNVLGPVVLRGFSDVGPRTSTHKAQRLVPFRLDRCMVRDLDCGSAKALHKGSSDHRPILIELSRNSRSDEQVA